MHWSDTGRVSGVGEPYWSDTGRVSGVGEPYWSDTGSRVSGVGEPYWLDTGGVSGVGEPYWLDTGGASRVGEPYWSGTGRVSTKLTLKKALVYSCIVLIKGQEVHIAILRFTSGITYRPNMRSTIFTLLTVIVAVSGDERRAAPLTCYNCPKVADSVDCQTTTTCEADEQCFTDKYIDEQGNVFFSLSCKSKRVCDILSSLGKRYLPEDLGERERRSVIHLCTQCCAAGMCNNKLCTAITTVKPAARCYHCDAEEDPESCVDIKTCDDHELCEAALQHGGNLHHGKRESNKVLCLGCCNDSEGCNHKGCYSISKICYIVIPLSVSLS
ncbi:hypothetical protein FSP39_002283 [Pinctada imbricata]|uniref:Uncharacterized protein n=1 Tax=Pinctada imbricata TaxID=66713 RepID=A0AA88XKL0_PINIB|nr:hypothetical protein FSP39_002283 [Pinctada imbricata]